ncbi:MAG: hypothetical protein H7Y42_03940, partial [Chitinophagaceae bacterium]|nr:hypothetical protein [Chitinophagaceae bacterium]
VVRFQNMGTDTAFFIHIRDTLDAKLDWSTFQMVAASHPYKLTIDDGNRLDWEFPGIELVHSSLNEPASHGFVAYRIKVNTDLVIGDVVENTASIYFDFNLPVVTNETLTEVMAENLVLPLTLLSFNGVYRDELAVLHWRTSQEENVRHFVVERSVDGREFHSVGVKPANGNGGNTEVSYEWVDNLANRREAVIYYRLRMVDLDGKQKYSSVIAIRRTAANSSIVFGPNPVTSGQAQVVISAIAPEKLELRVIDAGGKTRLVQHAILYRGANSIPIEGLSQLRGGSFFLQIIRQKEVRTVSFLVVD